jgi:hypothetical protein
LAEESPVITAIDAPWKNAANNDPAAQTVVPASENDTTFVPGKRKRCLRYIPT